MGNISTDLDKPEAKSYSDVQYCHDCGLYEVVYIGDTRHREAAQMEVWECENCGARYYQ